MTKVTLQTRRALVSVARRTPFLRPLFHRLDEAERMRCEAVRQREEADAARWQAVQQREEAEAEREAANQRTHIAVAQRDQAEAARWEAVRQREEADAARWQAVQQREEAEARWEAVRQGGEAEKAQHRAISAMPSDGQSQGESIDALQEQWKQQIRNEYTVMPRFGYHQPLDYDANTFPPVFEPAVTVAGEALPIPPAPTRMGYSADDTVYLDMGRYDHDLIVDIVKEHHDGVDALDVLDFGCSSGRVLRHFDKERRERNWRLNGVDIQAVPVEWMRRNFPGHFRVFSCTTLPHLQFPDNSLDLIYGISVFTHIKYSWDAWLMELRRVLRPGGLLVQTIHTENAWRFYHKHRDEAWVRENHSAVMLETAEMAPDFLYYGDIATSQVFWKRDIAREFWSRYLTVLDVKPPPERYSFQDWVVCRKD